MKSRHLISAVFTLIMTGFSFSSGQKIYLSPDGNDSNPGSVDKPLATLTAARDKAREYRKSGKTPSLSKLYLWQVNISCFSR